MKQEEWISRLRKQMADYEEAVPEGLWERIEQALPAEESAERMVPQGEMAEGGNGERRFRAVPMWKRMVAAAAVVLLLGGSAYIYNKVWMGEEHQPQLSKRETGAPERAVESENNGMADGQPAGMQAQRVIAMVKKPGAAIAEVPVVEELSTDTLPQSMPEVAEKPMRKGEEARDADVQTARAPRRSYPRESAKEPVGRRQAPRLSVSLYAQNMPNGSGVQTNPVMRSQMDMIYMGGGMNGSHASPLSAKPSGLFYLSDYEEQTDHRQPVTFGLSLSYPINDRFSLLTGVNYSRLSSRFTKKMGRSVLTTNQQLHYVGVPLRASYLVWSRQKLSLYGTAGGEIDLNVRAKANTEGVERTLEKDRPQLSVDAAAGVQYRFLRQISLYAEPGLRFFFDNGSPVENFYKDKPLQFSMQLGVRFDLK